MFIQNCLPIPTCKNTPKGGRRTAATMRQKSTETPFTRPKSDTLPTIVMFQPRLQPLIGRLQTRRSLVECPYGDIRADRLRRRVRTMVGRRLVVFQAVTGCRGWSVIKCQSLIGRLWASAQAHSLKSVCRMLPLLLYLASRYSQGGRLKGA